MLLKSVIPSWPDFGRLTVAKSHHAADHDGRQQITELRSQIDSTTSTEPVDQLIGDLPGWLV